MSQTKDTRKFQLAKGVIIPVAGTSKSYSYENITDEVALELIKVNPNRKRLFAKLPDNLDQLLSAKASDAGKGKQDPPVEHVKVGEALLSLEDALALLEKAEVGTQATTIKGVQKRIDGLKEEDSLKVTELLSVKASDAGNEE